MDLWTVNPPSSRRGANSCKRGRSDEEANARAFCGFWTTMGSKANDADIQRGVVQMKDELEKIKEQVLNTL